MDDKFKADHGVVIRGNERLVVLRADEVVRSGDCRDCAHLRALVSWWCTNEEAIAEHRTRIPGRDDCRFWKEAERAPA